jgi:hypothetical protein
MMWRKTQPQAALELSCNRHLLLAAPQARAAAQVGMELMSRPTTASAAEAEVAVMATPAEPQARAATAASTEPEVEVEEPRPTATTRAQAAMVLMGSPS